MNNKTAHEKLIEMGYTHSQLREDLVLQNNISTTINISEYYEKNAFNYICFSRADKNYKLGHVCVDIELSRILTQYLEELENDK